MPADPGRPWKEFIKQVSAYGSALCSDIPLSQWHSSILTESIKQLMSRATANCAKSAMIVEWPGIPCCHFTGVEQSGIIFLSLNITHYLPTRTEDIPTPFKLCRPPSWHGSFHFLNIDKDLGISCLVTPDFFILAENLVLSQLPGFFAVFIRLFLCGSPTRDFSLSVKVGVFSGATAEKSVSSTQWERLQSGSSWGRCCPHTTWSMPLAPCISHVCIVANISAW